MGYDQDNDHTLENVLEAAELVSQDLSSIAKMYDGPFEVRYTKYSNNWDEPLESDYRDEFYEACDLAREKYTLITDITRENNHIRNGVIALVYSANGILLFDPAMEYED